jgi:hypothetical protein
MNLHEFNDHFAPKTPVQKMGGVNFELFKEMNSKLSKAELTTKLSDLQTLLTARKNRVEKQGITIDDPDTFEADVAAVDGVRTLEKQIQIVEDLIDRDSKYIVSKPPTLH